MRSCAGVGDFQVADVNFLPDPCSLPDAQKKRALNEKERLLYAPMAGVGGLVYDKDAVYIDVPANHVKQQQVCLCVQFQSHLPNGKVDVCVDGRIWSDLFFCLFSYLMQHEVRPTTELVQSLIDTHSTLDAKMAASKMSLFSGSASLDPDDFEEQNR